MKAIILVFFASIGFVYSQPTEYLKVVSFDSLSKIEIYHKANEWVHRSLQFPKESIILNDEITGKIIGKGSIRFDAPSFNPGTVYSGYFLFDYTIESKDNKCRLKLENYRHSTLGIMAGENTRPFLTEKGWKYIVETAAANAQTVINSFTEFMNNTKEENW